MKNSARIIFSAIWLSLTALGFVFSASSLFGFSDYVTPNMIGSAGSGIFLLGPLICGAVAYLLAPGLSARRKEAGNGLILNQALVIPFTALVLVLMIYFAVHLVRGGINAAFIAPITVVMAIVSLPSVWGAIFGSGLIASIASNFYLRRN